MTSYIIAEPRTMLTIKQSEPGHGLTCFSMSGRIDGYDVYAWGQYSHEEQRVIATPEMKFEVLTPTGRYATSKRAQVVKDEFRSRFWNFRPTT